MARYTDLGAGMPDRVADDDGDRGPIRRESQSRVVAMVGSTGFEPVTSCV